MGLEKSIKSGKDRRKEYRGEKAFDKTTRNHGSDPYSTRNRLFSSEKREMSAMSKMKENDDEEIDQDIDQ